MGRYLEMLRSNTDTEAPDRNSINYEKNEISPLCNPRDYEKNEITNNQGSATSTALRPCGSLICRSCTATSPSPHRADCAFPRFDVCGSRWHWLSTHRAIKCVACAGPPDFSIVDAWVLAREDSIPPEILSLVHIAGPEQ
jgi:hypothetical protein